MNIFFEFLDSDLFTYIVDLSKGLPITLSLSLLAILFAFMLALMLSILLTFDLKGWQRKSINSFLIFFTGTPLYVQLLLIYSIVPFINGNLFTLSESLFDNLGSPYLAALVALTLNSTAYSTQLFYGAFKAIPAGFKEACKTLGMTQWQTLRITVHYGLTRALSSYANEVIFVVKGTAIVSTITLMDITGYYQKLIGQYYDITILFAAALLYLTINIILSLIMRIIEYRCSRFERVSQ